MSCFIFLCDLTTEQECLDRSLFGTNPGESHRDHYSKIAVGDRLFLYNFETGQLRGPYAALTPCRQNIDPAAWRKSRRNFPWQVRVANADTFKSPIGANELRKIVPLASTRLGLLPPPELTDEQARQLMVAFARKNPTD
jgi:hypothetical protein